MGVGGRPRNIFNLQRYLYEKTNHSSCMHLVSIGIVCDVRFAAVVAAWMYGKSDMRVCCERQLFVGFHGLPVTCT